MPPKAKPSSSGKSSGKSGGKAEDEIENNRKAIRKFLKTYEKSCQDKGLVLLPSISQKLNRLVKSEEGPNTLNIPFLITEELSLEAVQALIESLDSSIQGYEKISFWRNNLSEKTVQLIGKWLQPHPHLKELEIIDNRVGPKGCQAISRALQHNETLTYLNLDHNELGDEGAAALAVGLSWSPSLIKVSLNYCGIEEEGAVLLANEAIAKSSSLQILEMQGNSIGDRGFDAIGQALARSQKLQTLNLSGCNEGLPLKTDIVSRMCESIKQNPNNTLQNLDLNYITVEPEAVFMFAELAKQKENILRIRLYERVDKVAYKELATQLGTNLKNYIQKNKPKKKKKAKKKEK
ncbi:hypothetical protein FDP41_007206 [Naegleria fowleri]|uniref:Uncharacterized protein n=1 Tax=Naegleria fowleri TaxID=5763 RepID=A0A6A5BLN5_NAEFO|nr:uncharacterized protein FDP41_007206 [Naegleria fowleri]KAF0973819.1 hypothetical protein FDP41_007206 [Naegleria fowleri]